MAIHFLNNRHFGRGLPDLAATQVSTDVEAVEGLLALCPVYAPTPLRSIDDEARRLGIAKLWIKDERTRMGLGSFKALGAAFVVAQDAARAVKGTTNPQWDAALSGRVYVAASAGNHGLSIAAGARIFGARAVIYLSQNVPETFATRLKSFGADVVRAGNDYAASMTAAMKAAEEEGWSLLSDSTWTGDDRGVDVMQGYLVMARETCAALPETPSHIFLQAGVGGFAAAMAQYLRLHFDEEPQIVVVEPDRAPALQNAIEQGKLVTTEGGVSSMGRLDCKTASLSALDCLAKTANIFATLTDSDVESQLDHFTRLGLATTPSGGAGLACCTRAALDGLFGLNSDSRVLCFLTEDCTDA